MVNTLLKKYCSLAHKIHIKHIELPAHAKAQKNKAAKIVVNNLVKWKRLDFCIMPMSRLNNAKDIRKWKLGMMTLIKFTI